MPLKRKNFLTQRRFQACHNSTAAAVGRDPSRENFQVPPGPWALAPFADPESDISRGPSARTRQVGAESQIPWPQIPLSHAAMGGPTEVTDPLIFGAAMGAMQWQMSWMMHAVRLRRDRVI